MNQLVSAGYHLEIHNGFTLPSPSARHPPTAQHRPVKNGRRFSNGIGFACLWSDFVDPIRVVRIAKNENLDSPHPR